MHVHDNSHVNTCADKQRKQRIPVSPFKFKDWIYIKMRRGDDFNSNILWLLLKRRKERKKGGKKAFGGPVGEHIS